METAILIGAGLTVAAIVGGMFWCAFNAGEEPRGDWWDELDTTVEHRTRMFQGRDVTEIGRNPDAET